MASHSKTAGTCTICGQGAELLPAGESSDHKDWCGLCLNRYEFLLANRDQFCTDTLNLFRQMMAVQVAAAMGDE
jgi:hypothetical protein